MSHETWAGPVSLPLAPSWQIAPARLSFSTPPRVGEFPAVNAFQLRNLGVVPEPGTALFGLGLMGVALVRRR